MNRLILPLLTTLALGLPGLPAHPSPEAARQDAPDPFAPDTILTPPGGPRVVMLPALNTGVAALRLFVPLVEGPVERGAAHVILSLARERMEGLARPVGARVFAESTPRGLAYSVEGAVADFEFLEYLLREAVDAPNLEPGRFERVRRSLAVATSGTWEAPASRVDQELRARLARPGAARTLSPAQVEALDPARVLEVWRRTHQQSAMTLVVSAPVLPEVILAGARGMGSAEGNAGPSLDAPPLPRGDPPPAQVLRHWYGAAYDAGPAADPTGLVIARLVTRRLRATGGAFEASVRLWRRGSRWVLVTRGAAYPRNASALRRILDGILEETRNGLTETAVTDATSAERRAFLVGARTPLGLVTVVGRALDATGDPSAASRFRRTLGAVEPGRVRALLDRMVSSTPVRVELTP